MFLCMCSTFERQDLVQYYWQYCWIIRNIADNIASNNVKIPISLTILLVIRPVIWLAILLINNSVSNIAQYPPILLTILQQKKILYQQYCFQYYYQYCFLGPKKPKTHRHTHTPQKPYYKFLSNIFNPPA